MIQRVDIVLANCNSLRGALVDDGTAFQIDYVFSLGRLYENDSSLTGNRSNKDSGFSA
ncbi:hypothetical protein [Leptospira sp. P2653]|uniref:hypothetical protein n=1 Tax=Leptospira sp. P2653 TaxID=1218600 RepID=UPI0002BDC38F|nr:hypothetical protein [Leptospira sp. P2653]EMJ63275.1 hypothetical protein LEP1GSC051_2030 [Leptospira sp. P2653]